MTDKTYLNDSKWYCHLCPEISVVEGVETQTSPTAASSEDCTSTITGEEKVNIVFPDSITPEGSIDRASWGSLKGVEITESVNRAYSIIVRWKRNLFKVPTGKAGREFIEEVSNTITLFNSGSHLESVALTMTMIIFPLLLQKPSPTSKAKDHMTYLQRRLELWRSGEISKLLKEGSAIQKRLCNSKKSIEHHDKVFARLMLQGKVSAALKWVGSQKSTIHDINDDIIDVLKSKHPKPAPPTISSLIKGPLTEVEDVIFEHIDSNLISKVAKGVNGSAGPSGADADMWKHLLCSRQFKKKPEQLSQSIADLAKKLSTKIIAPDYLTSYIAGRLIPLDKNPGVRPIGVGEVLRRIVGKAVMHVLKPEIVGSTAPIQVCGGLKGGVEAAIHALRRIYNDDETECVLLVDAENAFNSLNRQAAINNLQYN